MHVLCVYVLKLLSDFFNEKRLATLLVVVLPHVIVERRHLVLVMHSGVTRSSAQGGKLS